MTENIDEFMQYINMVWLKYEKDKLEEEKHREENEGKWWICKGGIRINVSKSRIYKIFLN